MYKKINILVLHILVFTPRTSISFVLVVHILDRSRPQQPDSNPIDVFQLWCVALQHTLHCSLHHAPGAARTRHPHHVLAHDGSPMLENVHLRGVHVSGVVRHDVPPEVVNRPILGFGDAVVYRPSAREDVTTLYSDDADDFVVRGTSLPQARHDSWDVRPNWAAEVHLETKRI
jgi:hypothetical protein